MDLTEYVRPHIAGRRIFFAVDALAGATYLAATLFELGASDVGIIYAIEGVGDLPENVSTFHVPVGKADNIMGGLRAFQTAVRELQPETLDGWDPERRALGLGGPFDRDQPIAGRSVLGGRPDAYERLEDKMVAPDLWDAAGIEQAPYALVPADEAALREAAASLDRGLGTVWVADNREGWHGGGDYLRWIPARADRAAVAAATEFFTAHADRVRVMPFLEGVPCSVHGMVVGDRVLAFRPVEMVILRKPAESALLYAGLATVWDPRPEDRAAMRAMVRAVGTTLSERAGYRGAFGIDGIMTTDGFRPTELNPRLTGGLGIQTMGLESVHLGMINRLVMSGAPPDIDWPALEAAVVAAADEHRSSRCIMSFQTDPPPWQRLDLAWTGRAWREVGPDEADATLQAGNHPMGAVLLFEVTSGRVVPGRSLGPAVAAAVDLARAKGMDLPTVVAAQDVRPDDAQPER